RLVAADLAAPDQRRPDVEVALGSAVSQEQREQGRGRADQLAALIAAGLVVQQGQEAAALAGHVAVRVAGPTKAVGQRRNPGRSLGPTQRAAERRQVQRSIAALPSVVEREQHRVALLLELARLADARACDRLARPAGELRR